MNKKILLVGHKGSIGKRYGAILTHLNQKWTGLDIGSEDPGLDFTHVIIATPSETHLSLTQKYSERSNVLVEKPLTTSNLELVEWQAFKPKHPVFMVNNYSFLNTNPGFPPRVDKLEYNFYHTGKDGTALDCIQLLYLAHKIGAELEVFKTSPIWELWVNDKLKVPYEWIEWSYVQMMNAFISDRFNHLWPLSYGIEATEVALNLREQMEDKNAGFNWTASKIKQPKTA